MKAILTATLLTFVSFNAALAAAIPCQREGTLAAFRTVLEEKELRLTTMDGFAIQEAGVYLDKKVNEKVTLTVNLGLTENGLQRAEIVQVELAQSHDNACQVLSTKIHPGH